MLAIERRREILSRLGTDGKVIVSELARDFEVTEETIRRDLERLDREGLVSKTYGGAVAKQSSALDLPYNIRETVNVEQKQAN
ncbi:MAG: DeoR/GlpR transcriptional regulator, partial [Clostridia bacterium]|nr:DeoR/GlpR transcriptional regulator [Clostridia bacterium]